MGFTTPTNQANSICLESSNAVDTNSPHGYCLVTQLQDQVTAITCENGQLRSRIAAQQAEISAHQDRIKTLQINQEVLDLIYVSELSTYLPFWKQPDRSNRNEEVHGARIKYDLEFLNHPSKMGKNFLEQHKLTRKDMENAITTRYRYSPTSLGDPSKMPEKIARPIDIRSNVENLKLWTNRADLQGYIIQVCRDHIQLWLRQKARDLPLPENTILATKYIESLYQ